MEFKQEGVTRKTVQTATAKKEEAKTELKPNFVDTAKMPDPPTTAVAEQKPDQPKPEPVVKKFHEVSEKERAALDR